MQLKQTEKFEQPRPIFRNRPGLSAFIGAVSGIAAAYSLDLSWQSALYLLPVCVLALAAVLFIRRVELRTVISIVLPFMAGCMLYAQSLHSLESTPLARFALDGAKSRIIGVVDELDETRRGHIIIVEVTEAARGAISLPLYGRLAVLMDRAEEDAEIPLPRTGDSITIFADVYPLREKRNPYAQNYEARLKYHYRASAVTELNSRFDYYIRPSEANSFAASVASVFVSLRSASDSAISRAIEDPDARAFVRAVVLGKRGEIDAGVVLDFKYTGLTHLLAISGFNIAVVSLLIAQGLLLFGVRRRSVRLPVTAAGVALYCFTVGLEPSVLRAFIMIELYLLALAIERKSDLANIAALTALGHIILDPLVVHDAGFQLSYAAVFGFALIQPHLMRLLGSRSGSDELQEQKSRDWARHSIVLSLAAFLATAPVLIVHFKQVSLLVLAANVFVIPLAAVITVLGFLLIPLDHLSATIAGMYGEALGWMVQGLLTTSSTLAKIGGSGLEIHLAGWTAVLLAVILLWSLHATRLSLLVQRIGIAACAIVAFSTFVSFSPGRVLSDGKLAVAFLDVGQGDAALLKTPQGKLYMLDFGPMNGSDPNLLSRSYGGLLQAEASSTIAGGFLTHLHRDHYAAAVSAIYSGKLERIYTVGDRTSDEAAYLLDSMVRASGVNVVRLHTGHVLDLDPGVKLYVLAPDSIDGQDEITNDRSLVLKLVFGDASILLLGDIEQQAERALVKRYGEFLRSDVVKVAHHGSISSSTPELIRMAQAEHAVISCGRSNRFGHPHPKVVSRWLRSGAQVARTDMDGAIIFESDGKGFSKVNWK